MTGNLARVKDKVSGPKGATPHTQCAIPAVFKAHTFLIPLFDFDHEESLMCCAIQNGWVFNTTDITVINTCKGVKLCDRLRHRSPEAPTIAAL